MNSCREKTRPTRSRNWSVALLTAIILLLIFSATAKLQQIQLLRIINVGTGASATILGGTPVQHLSGNGSAGSFEVNLGNLRARAIATGDVNGDGIADIVTGAPEATFEVTPSGGPVQLRTGAGIAYVVFGESSLSGQIDTGAGEASVSILGEKSGDKLGFAVAVGDVNGDGIDDIVLGAPGADFPGSATPPPAPRGDTGAVFVILGAATLGSPSTIDLATTNAADVALFGVSPGDQFGAAVAVGNVGGLAAQVPDQQAVKDILVGAPGNNGPGGARSGAGAAYAQFGGEILNPVAGATTVFDLAASPANVVVLGKTGDALGASVAVGDVNGGQTGDLIVGAPLSERAATTGVPAGTDTGAVFGIFGGTNLIPAEGTSKTFDIDFVQQNLSIYGADGADHLGVSVAAGDVTGDGIPDVLAGAPDADGPTEERASGGEAYVVEGGARLNPDVGSERRIDLFGGGATTTLFGAATEDRLGSTVAAGNYNTPENSDNIPDLIAAAPGANSKAGFVSIVFGGSNLLLFPRDVLLGQDDVRILGQVIGDELGWAIATGDVNNNQGGELIVGAPFANAVSEAGTRTQAGVVYILPSTAVINQSPTVTVTAPDGGETLQVGQVFDITWNASDPNGDGTIQKFEIRLSTDGGTNFNVTVAPNVAGTARTFSWTVPVGVNTTQGRIRVIVTDNQNATAQDGSDANFTITDAGVRASLTSPDGGEILRFGQQFMIQWTVPDEVAALVKGFDLSLSTDGGATFPITIAPPGGDPAAPALGPGTRSFLWNPVPSICTGFAKVAVVTTSLSNVRTSDASADNFTIAAQGPTIDPAGMAIVDNFRLKLVTAAPQGGTEVLFTVGTLVQVSSDAEGTTFFSFSKPDGKIKRQGQKYLSKGLINGQELGVFFPNGQTRLIRITKPPCGLTLLRVTRNGDVLTLAAASEAEPVLPSPAWQ